MIAYNLKDIVEVLFGNVNISEVYIGVNKVFPSSGPVPPTPYSGFCRLTLSDSSVVEIEGSGELTRDMIDFGTVIAEVGTKCTGLGEKVFQSCTKLTTAIIPDTVTSISNSAFAACDKLVNLTIPDNITTIGTYAFRDCSSLTSFIIPDSVTSIGDYAFQGCSSLTSVTIGNSVASIGQKAFQNCSALTSVTISNSVASIGGSAFQDCRGLTSVIIGNGVTSIGSSVFYWCSALTSVTIEATTPPTLGTNAFNYTNNCSIYVPAESVEAYKTASRWSSYASRIQAIP